jgi:hypothetical protein
MVFVSVSGASVEIVWNFDVRSVLLRSLDFRIFDQSMPERFLYATSHTLRRPNGTVPISIHRYIGEHSDGFAPVVPRQTDCRLARPVTNMTHGVPSNNNVHGRGGSTGRSDNSLLVVESTCGTSSRPYRAIPISCTLKYHGQQGSRDVKNDLVQ